MIQISKQSDAHSTIYRKLLIIFAESLGVYTIPKLAVSLASLITIVRQSYSLLFTTSIAVALVSPLAVSLRFL